MRYVKLYEDYESYKSTLIYWVEENFQFSIFDFIDEFIDIEDISIDVNINFNVRFKNRANYPKACNLDTVIWGRNPIDNVYQTRILDRRTSYEKRFYYGITYCGVPIKKEDIVYKDINLTFITLKYPSKKPFENIKFSPIFKEKVSSICNKYNLKIKNEQSTMEKIGYTSYNVSLIPA